MKNIKFHHYFGARFKKEVVTLLGLLIVSDNADYSFDIGGKSYCLQKFFGIFYKVNLPISELLKNTVHTPILIQDSNNKKSAIYFTSIIKKGLLLRGRILFLRKRNLSVYFRGSTDNKFTITIRPTNKTDYFFERVKTWFAYFFSYFIRFRNINVLFEKFGEKYGESASVLFEQLIVEGYSNSYFILDAKTLSELNLAGKYRKNIVTKGSFKHYLYLFAAKSFFGTDPLDSAFDADTVSKLFLFYAKLSKRYNQVFLQHGVMYMVSMNSETRKGFRFGNWFPERVKIVVSSKIEGEHFKSVGYPESSLYYTGLPKFDRSTLSAAPNKILIMPTWRNWESSLMKGAPTQTSYYKMLASLYNSVPISLRKHVVVAIHPSYRSKLEGTELESAIYIKDDYNDILEQTKLLITDYSSISYDSFFRGSNVIFWWKDKGMCMSRYGGSLMLDERSVFGDICYNKSDLSKFIVKNYEGSQESIYRKRFEKIVEFSDRKNTKRLINKLKKDGYISK